MHFDNFMYDKKLNKFYIIDFEKAAKINNSYESTKDFDHLLNSIKFEGINHISIKEYYKMINDITHNMNYNDVTYYINKQNLWIYYGVICLLFIILIIFLLKKY